MPRIHETYEVLETAADRLTRVARLLRFRAAGFLRAQGLDITPEQWRLLLLLKDRDGRNQGDLADPLLGDYPNVTRMLDGLVRRGLVQRRPNPDDRRVVLVTLTMAGRDVLDQTLPELIQEKERYFDGLDRRELTELNRVLDMVESNLVRPPEA